MQRAAALLLLNERNEKAKRNAQLLTQLHEQNRARAEAEAKMRRNEQNVQNVRRLQVFEQNHALHEAASRVRSPLQEHGCTLIKKNPDGTYTSYTNCNGQNRPRTACHKCTLEKIGKQRVAMMIAVGKKRR